VAASIGDLSRIDSNLGPADYAILRSLGSGLGSGLDVSLNRQDDVPLLAVGFDVTVSVGGLFQGIASVDDRPEPACLYELSKLALLAAQEAGADPEREFYL
jgi:hypothetical protein